MRNRKAGVGKGNVTVTTRSVEKVESACCQEKQLNRTLEEWAYQARYHSDLDKNQQLEKLDIR